jgi:Flp pilus assembly pilin Flp
MKKILKNKRGSPLVEEGLLLGIAAVAFTIILSIVAGILMGVQSYFNSVSNNAVNSFNDFLKQINDILTEIARKLGIV